MLKKLKNNNFKVVSFNYYIRNAYHGGQYYEGIAKLYNGELEVTLELYHKVDKPLSLTELEDLFTVKAAKKNNRVLTKAEIKIILPN